MNPKTSHNRAHLVVCSDAAVDANAVQQIAQSCGISAYDVRLRLKADVPRPLVTLRQMEDAQQKAAALSDLGLTTIAYVEKDLPPMPMWPAFRAEWGTERIRLTSRKGDERSVGTDEIALLVYGRKLQHGSHKEHSYRMSALSTPYDAARMFGDATAGDRGKAVRSIGQEHFVIAFFADPARPPIEFSAQAFDYACLGKHRAETKLMSHEVLVTVLRKLFKNARFDTRLLQGQSDNRGDAYYNRRIAPDSSWANATLIYWEMLAARSESRHYCAVPAS